MRIQSMTCPSCGAQVSLAEGQNITRCRFCRTQVYMDDEVQHIEQHIQYDNAEEAGYSFEKGRQRAQMEIDPKWQQPPQYQQTAQYGNQWVPQQQVCQPKKRNTLLWVLGWILFFPIPLGILLWRNRNTEVGKVIIWGLGWLVIFPLPLTILMLRKKDMPSLQRNGIIAGAWIVYLLLGIMFGIMSPQTDDIADNKPQSTLTTTKTESEQNQQEQEHREENEQAPVEQPPVEQPPVEQPPVMDNPIPLEEQPPVAEDVSHSESQVLTTEPEPDDNSQLATPSEEQVVNQEPSITQTPEVSSVPTESNNTSSVVYITPNGHSYHRSRSCPRLSRSKEVFEVSLGDAIAQGKSDPCDSCAL